MDDDIDIDTRSINDLFALSHAFKASISQAALSRDSYCSWPIFKQQKNSFLRFVGQIEVMAPLFDRETLKVCLPTFIANRSSWGVDAVWSKILDYPKDKLLVFDRVPMKHTLPVGGGELYQKIGVDPLVEWEKNTTLYHAKKQNYQEYGRLQIVNSQSHPIAFSWYKGKELVARGKRAWGDYNLWSRVISQKNKFFKKVGIKSL